MSYENCTSRQTRKRALSGCHRMGAPHGRAAASVYNEQPERSLGAVAMAIVSNMLRFGRGNK